jgi:hypothetical protein
MFRVMAVNSSFMTRNMRKYAAKNSFKEPIKRPEFVLYLEDACVTTVEIFYMNQVTLSNPHASDCKKKKNCVQLSICGLGGFVRVVAAPSALLFDSHFRSEDEGE